MSGIIEAGTVVGNIYKIIQNSVSGDSDDKYIEKALNRKASDLGLVASTQGSMTKLLSDFIVEPLVIITENASANEITDKVAEITTDVFAGFYMQTFEVINSLYGVDAKTAISLLGTDNGMKNIRRNIGNKLVNGFLSREDASGNWSDLLLESPLLTVESSIGRMTKDTMNEIKDDRARSARNTGTGDISRSDKYKSVDEALGSALLQRTFEVKMKATITNDSGVQTTHTITLPITVKARIVKVKLSSILLAIKPKKPGNSITMSFLDYRAGLKSLGDFLFSSKLIKEYKDQRLKGGDEFLSMLNNRKASSTAKLASDGAIGFEKNYNSYIITEEDRIVINKELGGDIYKPRYKDMLMDALDGLSISVLDEDHERLVVLTSNIDGMSDTSFRNLKKSKDKGSDISELVKALFNNRPMF